MKKLTILFIILCPLSLYAADTKVTALTENTAVLGTDILYLVDDPGGTPASQKITVTNLFDAIDTSNELLTILTDETGSGVAVFGTNPTLTGATLAGILADNDDMVFEADADNDGSNKFSFTDGASAEVASISEAGLLSVLVGIDAIGNVDFDIGSADVDDVTVITDGGTWILDDTFTFPDADTSPDASGELVYDNTVTGFLDGLFAWYDDDEVRYIVDVNATNLPGDAEDDYVLAYDKDADHYYFKADADSGGSTAYDDIGDPDASGSISFDDGETATYTSAGLDEDFFTINLSAADLTSDVNALVISAVDNDDTNFIPFLIQDDSGGTPDDLFKIDSTGAITTGSFNAGAVTSSGSVTTTTSVIAPLFDAAGDEDMDYGSADVDDHTFTTDGTGDAEFVVPDDSIGNDELDWGSMTDLTTNGALGADVVDEAHIADDGIDSEHYNDASIDLAHMASQSVDSDNIKDDEILEADLNVDEAAADNDILTYDTTGSNFSWQTPSELITAGTNITWSTTTLNVDDAFLVNDADDTMAGDLTLDDDDAGTGLTVRADAAGGGATVGMLITTDDDDSANYDPFEIRDDSGTNNDLLFFIDHTGTVQTGIWDAGAITSSGTVEGATLTEGGNAVYNSTETPGGELGGTWASPTLDDSVAVSSWNLTTPTFTTNFTFDSVTPTAITTEAEGIGNDDSDTSFATNAAIVDYVSANGGSMSSFVAEDGDTTEVSISDAEEWKFVEGASINIDWTDTSTGSDADPFDLTFALVVADDESTADAHEIVFTTDNATLESDGDYNYNPSTGTVTATEFSGGGSSLTDVDAVTGDSATAFFDAGTIEHEYGGLEADVSAYTGLVGINGGATIDVNTAAELETYAELGAFFSDYADDADAATMRTTLGLAIGTDVLAEQTIGIADDNLVEMDDADAADDDFARFTANGLEGRSAAETLSDIGAEGDLSNEAGLYAALSDVTQFYEAGDEDTIAAAISEGSLADDIIVEGDLKAVNASADEDILTKEDTTGDFEWHSASELGIGTATSITDDLIVMADLDQDSEPSDGDVLTYDSTGANFDWITPNAGTDITADLEEEVTEGSLADDTIVEADLKAVDAAADEDFFTYEATTGDFEWHSASDVADSIAGAISAGALTNDSVVDADIDDDGSFAFTGTWDFGGANIEIENGTDPDVANPGEISIDTDGGNEPNSVTLRTIEGDDQYLLADSLVTIQATVVNPQDMDDAERDQCPLWYNSKGMTFHITEIWAWAPDDDTDVNLEIVSETDFSSPSTLDALSISTDGTSVFYCTETTFTDSTVASGEHIVGDFDDTDDPGYVKFAITGYFDADVD